MCQSPSSPKRMSTNSGACSNNAASLAWDIGPYLELCLGLFPGAASFGSVRAETRARCDLRPTTAEVPAAMQQPSDYRVRMSGISKRYGAIQVLDDVSLALKPGEVLGLVGDNGAGKSTLSKVLSGAIIPDTGRILLNGREVRFASPAAARRQRVEMVYQDLSLCDTVDVAGNLLLGREPLRRMLGVPIMDKH